LAHLTDTQLLVLSRASQRQDGFVEAPPSLTGAARKRVIEPLIKRGFLKEVPASKDAPVWRRDDALGPFALTLTKAGEKAIGVAPEESEGPRKGRSPLGHGRERSGRKNAGSRSRRQATQIPGAPRAGTKLAGVIALLRRKNGASIDDLTATTGWLPHTARAALTGLRKRGYAVEAERGKNKKAVYRIAATPAEEAKQRS
jgi:hypothetical protein